MCWEDGCLLRAPAHIALLSLVLIIMTAVEIHLFQSGLLRRWVIYDSLCSISLSVFLLFFSLILPFFLSGYFSSHTHILCLYFFSLSGLSFPSRVQIVSLVALPTFSLINLFSSWCSLPLYLCPPLCLCSLTSQCFP